MVRKDRPTFPEETTFPIKNQRMRASWLHSGHKAGGIQSPCLWVGGELLLSRFSRVRSNLSASLAAD